MLNKLLKHEFRSTARIMLPVLGVILLLAIMSGFSTWIIDSSDTVFWLVQLVLTLVKVLFWISLFAMGVAAVVLMIYRFFKNLLMDEGYLSWTLPVSVDGHIWSKLITSTVWMLAVMLIGLLAVFLVSFIGSGFQDTEVIRNIFQSLRESFAGQNAVKSTIEMLLLLLVCFLELCLRFYAAMSIGASAANNKKLLSVLVYIGLGFVRNTIGIIGILVLGRLVTGSTFIKLLEVNELQVTAEKTVSVLFVGTAVIVLAECAVYYILTRVFLKKKLNLT